MERVIIVDDELLFQKHLEKQICKFPEIMVVGKFENGLKAQQYLMNDHNVSIAFVDITMPVMSGLELAMWIKTNLPTTKVVLISAHQDFEFAREAIHANVYQYLCKPLRLEELSNIFEDFANTRLYEQKKNLYVRKLDVERQNLALFHDVISGVNNYFCADWRFVFQNRDPNVITDSMLTTALGNIIRYCSVRACPVIMSEDNSFHALVIADDESGIPCISSFENKATELLGFEVQVHVRYQGSCEQYRVSSCTKDFLDLENSRIIERAKIYIQNNISSELSRDEVAKAVYMSSSHFSRLFKKEIGISFQDYVKQVRIKKVLELLNNGYKVSEAYTSAGFSNRNYFNEVFKKEIGCSPSEYIKRVGHKGDML